MRRTTWIGMILVALAMGCAKTKPPPPPPVPISGKIMFAGGKPVANMVISLHAQEEQNAGDRPSGHVDKDGKYSLNATPGRYKVTLVAVPSGSGSAGAADLAVPKKADPTDVRNPMAPYRDAQTSPLELTVPATGGEMPTLTLK